MLPSSCFCQLHAPRQPLCPVFALRYKFKANQRTCLLNGSWTCSCFHFLLFPRGPFPNCLSPGLLLEVLFSCLSTSGRPCLYSLVLFPVLFLKNSNDQWMRKTDLLWKMVAMFGVAQPGSLGIPWDGRQKRGLCLSVWEPLFFSSWLLRRFLWISSCTFQCSSSGHTQRSFIHCLLLRSSVLALQI